MNSDILGMSSNSILGMNFEVDRDCGAVPPIKVSFTGDFIGSLCSATKADCCVTPERSYPCPYPTLPSPRQSVRTCSRCRALLICSPPPRAALPPARRSTARSTTRPTSSPPPASTPAPATSATCSTASATACRSCRPPTPASPRSPSWSIPPSRSPTRCCSSPPATARRPPSPSARRRASVRCPSRAPRAT